MCMRCEALKIMKRSTNTTRVTEAVTKKGQTDVMTTEMGTALGCVIPSWSRYQKILVRLVSFLSLPMNTFACVLLNEVCVGCGKSGDSPDVVVVVPVAVVAKTEDKSGVSSSIRSFSIVLVRRCD